MTFAVAIVLIVGWLFVNLTSLSREYPHYFQWDMDLTSTIDGLMLGSGQIPAHINHTGFGMYLLHAATIKLARQTDAISVSSLEEVSDSLDPLSGVSELTTFLRLHSPYVGVALVLLVWAALSILFRPTRLVSIMALAVLSTMTALLYHATLIRTEFYAVLFWSGALFLVGLAVRAGRPRNTLFWIFGAGVLLGICFLSKIQTLFYVAGLPLFLLLGLHHGSDAALRPTEAAGEKRRARTTLVVSGLNALLFSLLLLEANRIPLPFGLGVFEYGNPTGTLELAPYATLLVVSLIGIFFAQWIFIRQGWLESGLVRFLGLLSWLAAGFTASFLLHFVVLSPPELAYTYLLLDAKMLFFRGSYYDIRPFSAYLADAAVIVRHTAWPLGCHLSLLAILVAGSLRGWIAISVSQLLVLVSATSLLFLQILLATRPLMRDMIFVEPLADILTLVFVMVIVQKGIRHRTFLTVVCVIVMTTLIGSNLLYASRPQQDLDFNGSQYGWHPGRWFSQVYYAQYRFSLLMSGRYPIESRVLAQEQAIREAEVRRTTDFVFQESDCHAQKYGPTCGGLSGVGSASGLEGVIAFRWTPGELCRRQRLAGNPLRHQLELLGGARIWRKTRSLNRDTLLLWIAVISTSTCSWNRTTSITCKALRSHLTRPSMSRSIRPEPLGT